MNLSQGVPISIQLKTEVKQAEKRENFYFDLQGQIIRMGNTLYIRYKEEQEDGETASVTIKIEPDGKIQLIRSGELHIRLKFGYLEHLDTIYRTPYGLLQITTFTRNLRFSLKDRPVSGSIMVDYDLHTQGEKLGEYHLELEFTV